MYAQGARKGCASIRHRHAVIVAQPAMVGLQCRLRFKNSKHKGEELHHRLYGRWAWAHVAHMPCTALQGPTALDMPLCACMPMRPGNRTTGACGGLPKGQAGRSSNRILTMPGRHTCPARQRRNACTPTQQGRGTCTPAAEGQEEAAQINSSLLRSHRKIVHSFGMANAALFITIEWLSAVGSSWKVQQ